MTRVRELARAAYHDRKTQIDRQRTGRYWELLGELVEMGLEQEGLCATAQGVTAESGALVFRRTDDMCAYLVRDEDWPAGVWRWFLNLADLGEALETPIGDYELQETALEKRIVEELAEIGAALRSIEVAAAIRTIAQAIELPAEGGEQLGGDESS